MSFSNPSIILHSQTAVDYTIFDCKWIPGEAKLTSIGIKPNASGIIQVQQLLSSNEEKGLKLVQEIPTESGLRCSVFNNDNNLITGNYKGQVEIRDASKLSSEPKIKWDAHKQLVTTVDCIGDCTGRPEVVSGGQDGKVKVWDVRQKDKAVLEMIPDDSDFARECWTVAFGGSYGPEERYVCAGFDSGDIKIFDMRKCSVYWEHKLDNGVCCVQFDRKDIRLNKLVAVGLNSSISVFDLLPINTLNIKSVSQKEHDSTIWTVRHLPQNREVFVTCGGTGSLNLWKYNYPAKRITLNNQGEQVGEAGTLDKLCSQNVSTQPICSLDWNREMLGLACAGAFDQCIRILISTKLNLL
ncbi:hypothetical protein GJ496_011568 [Pomphorhynchus laevis]|nr:hypothetical protein GJ496_011568 [Pomphorhynchus laevis]